MDVVSNHMNSLTLNFKDIDLECEWRLKEIRQKQVILFVIAAYRLLADLVFNVLANKSSW